MSERVRRMRRGLERDERERLALLIDCLKKRTDRRTLTPYALLLPQELAELSLKQRRGIGNYADLSQVSEVSVPRLHELVELVELCFL